MTRSVEIPEAAVEAALAAHYRQPVPEWKAIEAEEQMRAALLAALPYLAPSGDGGLREAEIKRARHRSVCKTTGCPDCAAPAVPQPVDREAARRWIAEAIDAHYEEWLYLPVYNKAGELISSAAGDAVLDLLNGIEAAQPVDREALVKAIAGPSGDWLSRHQAGIAADRVLAVLAGEQEQVEP